MKKLLLLLVFTNIIYAQTSKVQQDLNNFKPGKIIVKLKDNVDTKTTYNAKGRGTSEVNIGQLLGIESKIKSTTILFTEKAVLKSVARKKQKSTDYRVPNPGTLKNIFLVDLNSKTENIQEILATLNKNEKVEYAEPDFNYDVNDFTIDSDIIYPKKETTNNAVTPNDPLYGEQTNIAAVKIDNVWDAYGTGDGSQTIAILDTGIDYTHPDLAENIWINEAELNGVEGFDDDENGYIDDIRGWDFINVDNAPLDDNLHGTHVAGIAGAVGGNGIGIAGAVWNVKLMPIKVFQSNGVGNASTIAEGVTYASENGATILNMSFGSYAESSTLKSALENAYATSVLVASAGNDGISIGPCLGCYPLYPAAYTFVLGVEDSPKPLLGYTNYDPDGPIFSGYSNLLNYETTAPGTSIMSAVPNGGYRKLTGTSMSSPLLAGGVALYLQQNPDDSKELLFGNLINTAATFVDIEAAITVVPEPQLRVLSALVLDTINGQNGNDFIEPNETIEIFPLVKNYWGPTDDVRVGIEFAEFEDQTKATILESEIAIGSITAYANLQDLTKSLKVQIADGVANNVNIKFNLKVWSGPDKEYLASTEFVISVKNSILLFGIICEDLTLYPNKEYLVSNNLVICSSATLNILPGVNLKISDDKAIKVDGFINAIGTKDSIITFSAENNSWNGIEINNSSIFKYSKFMNISGTTFNNRTGSYLDVENCIFTDNKSQNVGLSYNDNHIFNKCVFTDNLRFKFTNNHQSYNYKYSNIIGNSSTVRIWVVDDNFESNNIFSNKEFSFVAENDLTFDVPNYFGSASSSIISSNILDFLDDSRYGVVYLNTYLSVPSNQNHGIVWKVLVNGKDAQDEYELMDPVGVGTHTFDVYFNREMDKTKPPQVSYGVREPYNQKIISEAGTWSADGKIYTVTHEVKIGTADGINRIRVQDARDLDYFDIPVEDSRFNMLVQSAGSASTGFLATAGLGEIGLEWVEPTEDELEDVLGYNMYRYEAITDTTFTASQKINENLITDVTFEDFDVEEEVVYFYRYKILRTNFEETDFSTTVTTQPLTSILGDSNGDFEVNVNDLLQDVDYILGSNPTPFIFKAADVNNDATINVLDITGTVDLILNPSADKTATKGASSINYYSNDAVGDATFYWEGNNLYIESKYDVGGIQLAFNPNFEYTVSDNLSGIERLEYTQDDFNILMLYSFNNTVIANTKTKILTRANASQQFDIDLAVVGTTNGAKLNAVLNEGTLGIIDAPFQSNQLELLKLYPNPSDGIVNLQYYLPELMDGVTVKVYDIRGRLVWADSLDNVVGKTTKELQLSSLKSGNYIVMMSAYKNGGVKYLSHKMLILK
jgi:subtilisin family serine protease